MKNIARTGGFFVLLVAAVCCRCAYAQLPDAHNIGLLKQIEPTLAGTDVNIALICRSMTYIDGIPQNDYRPDITHRNPATAGVA